MFVLYNILQLVLLPVSLPFILLLVLFGLKYRDQIPARLGLGLAQKLAFSGPPAKTIWLHALSVGEVTSAVPLITGLREAYPASRIIVSVTTRTGKSVADSLLASLADQIINSPFDILPVVTYFVRHIKPSLFILVETDLWPNTLLLLQKKNIPSILVNGRVSDKSMRGYKRLRFFFLPMFQSFSFLCLQTQHDREKMLDFGLAPERLLTLGNLKFDTSMNKSKISFQTTSSLIPKNRITFICGSTHAGEEQILIKSYVQVRKTYPELFLIIAPRDTRRTQEIKSIAEENKLQVSLRSDKIQAAADVLIVNTIGELVYFYGLADIAFVGGSLVAKGGHNPIEPASMGLPVIFGPNMQDFCEIAEDLIDSGGAMQISNQGDLDALLSKLLSSPELRVRLGRAAQQSVESHRGVIYKHLELIQQLL